MSITIARKFVPDPNNPTAEVVARCIELHQAELKRLERLNNYYDGNHDIKSKTYDKDVYKNTVVNEAKKITDLNVAFATGNAVSYSSTDEIEPLLDVFKEVDIEGHDVELEKDLSVFGYSNELHYLKPIGDDETKIMVQKIDPRGSFVVTDDTLDKEAMFGVRYFETFDLNNKSAGYEVEIYAATTLTFYTVQKLDMKKVTELEVKENPYGKVPLIEFRNNEEKQGDFEPVIDLIDAYNTLTTDRLNDKEAHLQAILVAYGYSIVDAINDTNDAKGEQMAIDVPDPAGRTEFLTNPLDETQVEILANRIKEDLHEISNTPNLNDKDFAGNISGEAMKWKIFGLLNNLGMKQRYFIKGIRKRLELLQAIIKVKLAKEVDITNIEIKMTPFIPANLSEIISNISQSQEFIPLQHSLSWLPDVDDPSQIIEQLREQKAESIEVNQQILGASTGFEDEKKESETDDDESED
ncbi:phage portal protein [Pseudolactococcus reticulitermitis]|uniref:Phage portal protein n=1 Tax=Pseudolactococcus reticulitermitis TaxID=2025039 RepID=A0A224WWU4_9LACT|nr:phage portal protein [Lactococcus reticulitermitis]GAX46778.1 hypothetical protein RsY01_357 [Lactococcus reticulitermitis]